jgi:hypothetical protein
MLESGKARVVRAFVTASSPRSQDADLYRRYAIALYRQALLTRDDPPLAEHGVCDVLVNERALAAIRSMANTRTYHDDHHGSRGSGAWAGGG